MKQSSTNLSGISKNWESEALVLLHPYEGKLANQIPELELRTRVLQKLCRVKRIQTREHLAALIARIVTQVRLDYRKSQRRHQQHHDYSQDVSERVIESSSDDNERTTHLRDLWEELLGTDSPLDGSEKALLQIAFDDPVSYLRPDGRPNQSKLAERLGLNQRSVGRRWQKLLSKVETWKRIREKAGELGGPDLETS